MGFRIDDEFRALIPPLLSTEREELEASIATEGVRDPLVVWIEEDILLDGHNRYEIANRLRKPFNTTGLSFPDRAAAKCWMIRNQFGRRNLTPYQRGELVLALEEILRPAAKERQGTRTDLGGDIVQNSEQSPMERKVIGQLAAAAGVSHDTIHKVKVIHQRADEDTKAKLRAGETSIHAEYQKIKHEETEQKREQRRQENATKVATVEAPQAIIETGARFATIVIDPPWDWGDEGDVNQLGRAKHDYAGMPFEEIAALPVGDLADVDCHLYLWITNRSLPKGFTLLERWGFRYITCLTWVKPSFGMGNYFRGQTEHVLFGVRGSQALKRKDVGTVFHAERGDGGHSSKPEPFFALVESCSPGPYIEMFGRQQRAGWKTWGEDGIRS